ncbi:hypothetical protein EPH95_05610 [Salicibibacter halophilus]|uniref:Uncharacterized protein n=1 Tax=Salicibibacter halophilus TaxID=2502791 RepID=A0A514LFU3_9BACI|nr:hypothetical protein EPH95_05610 [Salicibibacter halophilus]
MSRNMMIVMALISACLIAVMVMITDFGNGESKDLSDNMDADESVSLDIDEVTDGKEEVHSSYDEGMLEDKVFDYEEKFSQNDYAGDTDAEDQVAFEKGSGNVLVSAPHTTTHERDGKVRDAEIYTGSIALLLQKYSDVHVIYNVYEGEDHNHVIGGEYKEKIGDIIEEKEIDLVVDIHGSDASRDFDLDIGTINGETVSAENVELLKYSFNNQDIHEVHENDTFSASGEGTITNHTWNQYNTEAMQLEIHRDYRDPRNDFDSYVQILKSLVFYVENADQ